MEFDLYFKILLVLFVFCLQYGTEASQNLALRKPARQSSTLDDSKNYAASRANDGFINQKYDSSPYCTHTDWKTKRDEAWWQVNLGSTSDIKNVTIYYRKTLSNYESTKRLSGFEVKVSTTASNWRTKQSCHTDDNQRPYPPDISTVQCVDQGQYVTIYNSHYVEQTFGAILELCEVQVFGCTSGYYGMNDCSKRCSSRCLNSVCDPDNGNCYGCATGYYGMNDCSQRCSSRCLNYVCDPDNGNCYRCAAGFYGRNDCSQQCPSGCLDSICNPDNGNCNGCKKGWIGNKCDTECPVTTFGDDCSETCHCANEGCHHINGDCDDDGCLAGWNGTQCNIPCQDNTFGPNCKHKCHCLNGVCFNTNGTCTVPGCAAGWSGKTCSVACTEKQFGKDCMSTCHCKSEGCDRINGICKNSVCDDGWKGQRCDEACENDTFAFNCSSTCYCATGSCNHISGECDTAGCQKGWQGVSCSESLVESQPSGPDSNGMNILPIIVGIAAVLVVAVICGIIVYAIRRKKANNKKPEVLAPKFGDLVERGKDNNEGTQYVNVGDVKVIEPKNSIKKNQNLADDIYENATGDISPTLIKVKKLKTVISKNNANEEFNAQYKKIPFGALHPHTAGEIEINKQKNRFLTTFPYDHSRVVLNILTGDPNSDYINASYIDSVDETSHYVATQGPRKNTLEDFWRMIWQIKCGKIVMLTNLVENGKVKCAKYWPDFSKTMMFGDFKIALETERENLYFSIKVLTITQAKTGEIRSIQHFHFTAWPDHGTPDPIQLMLFHQRYMEIPSDQLGPTIVHCSAGVGRTGTFIALDALYKQGKKTGEIDVSKYVTKMRENRMNMIQTKEQYVVLHEALLEAFQFRDTSHKKEAFRDSDREIKEEYGRLNKSKPVFDIKEVYKGAHEKGNQTKNRNNNILPVDRYRPYLMSHSSARTNYINAVILPSFREHVGFLATQYPLPDTVVDLWCMIHDHDSSTIVTLDKLPKNEKDVEWLPKDSEELVCGSFTIRQTRKPDICGETKDTELAFRYEGNERAVKLLQFQGWDSNEDIPSSTNGILKLIEMVNSWKLAGEKGPIAVICTDGSKCCGVFCLIYNIIQSLRYEDSIDIFQSVRLLQLRRPEFFPSIEQYRFCYKAVQDYLETANVYYN